VLITFDYPIAQSGNLNMYVMYIVLNISAHSSLAGFTYRCDKNKIKLFFIFAYLHDASHPANMQAANIAGSLQAKPTS